MSAAKKLNQAPTTTTVTREEFDAIVKAANAAEPGAVQRLREMLDENPQVWRSIGDMGKEAEISLVHLIAKGNVLQRESLLKQLKELRAELCSAKSSRMEQLLVDRFVLSWLHLQYLNARFAVQDDGQTVGGGKYVMHLRQAAGRELNAALQGILTYRKFTPTKFTIARSTVRFPGVDPEEKE